jgi:DNA-binding transcriptional ArsR family regulator
MPYRLTTRKKEILCHLRQKPAKTVTELAERIDALQPSVSRTLHLLKRQGLVAHSDGEWHLTQEGEMQTLDETTMQPITIDEIIMQEITGIVYSITRIQKMLRHSQNLTNIVLALRPISRLIQSICSLAEANENHHRR